MQTGRDTLTGRHGQVGRTFRGTRREAEKALAAFYIAIVERPATPPGKRSMSELLTPGTSWRRPTSVPSHRRLR